MSNEKKVISDDIFFTKSVSILPEYQHIIM